MFHKYIAHNSLLPIYLAWQLNPKDINYNLCFSYKLPDREKVELLIASLQKLINLKAYLRQTFELHNGELVATIYEMLLAEINYLASTRENFPQLEDQIIKIPHDINHQSSVKLTIVHITDSDEYIALFNIHHIIVDGITLDNFITDLNNLVNKKKIYEEDAETYIASMSKEIPLEEPIDSTEINRYTSHLNEIQDELNFHSGSCSKKYFHYTDVLPKEVFRKLRNLSKKQSLSIFNLLLISQSIFFAKLFNQNAHLVYYPVNIRQKKALNGCLINSVAFPSKIAKEDSYFSFINAFKNELPFLKFIARKNLNSLFQLNTLPSFAASNIAKPLPLFINSTYFEAKTYGQAANSALSVKYQQRENKLYFVSEIIEGFVPTYLAESLLSRFFYFLHKILKHPSMPLNTIDLTFEDEKHKLLVNFNSEVTSYPKQKSIHQLFEEQAKKNPHRIALSYDNWELSYGDLNKHANQLAHYLISKYKVQPEELIVLYLHRNPSLIIALLATLKMGGAYVSLSLNSHEERIKHVLQDVRARIVLTNHDAEKKINHLMDLPSQAPIVIDDEAIRDQLNRQKSSNLSGIPPSKLAHVIYTSGTTGVPKGVMIEHQGVVSLVKNTSYFSAHELDTFALLSDVSFDALTFEVWGALLNGAKLFIPYNRLELFSDAEKLKEVMHSHQVTILLLTKTLFDQLFHLDETLFSELRYLLIGGEQLNKSLIYNLASSQYKPLKLINAYGPTENTTISCTFDIQSTRVKTLTSIPIGMPIANRKAYILDRDMNCLPLGAIGELHVGGDGLARGYLNQTELTRTKFISNPYQTLEDIRKHENTRLYKTGDVARFYPDGNIEFLGRNDAQIKIRGYRVELEEIENKLINYPKIKQVVVIESRRLCFDPLKEQFLIAYYISDFQLNDLDLISYLKRFFPEYMLPYAFVRIKEFPITISGKLDVKRLPIPILGDRIDYLPPTTTKEKLICDAFASILAIEKVGKRDDFFSLGGNSIKVIELAALLHTKFDISVSDIFTLKTPENIASKSHLSKNNVRKQLKKIKLSFKKKKNENLFDYQLKDQLPVYFENSKNRSFSLQKKAIRNVLVTGATGYLGCNIVWQLLQETNYNIFLLVRDDSEKKAFHRINRKFTFYFDKELTAYQGKRIFVFPSDIEKEKLGLSVKNYQFLAEKVDSIIHAAALTKHYGSYDTFYSANVQATINLLHLCYLTSLKDFHYISTISTLDNNLPLKNNFYTEDTVLNNLNNQPNIYIKTKFEAEKKVIKYRKKGITANLYRVGNLAFISKNFRVQENIEDNAFFTRMKCITTLKCAPLEIGLEEISPVDFTAQAIIRLFDKTNLSNQIFHLFNPHFCNVVNFFSKLDSESISIVPINEFLDLLANNLDKPNINNKLIMRFLLHQGWLEGENRTEIIKHILQNRTNIILEQLDFRWPEITKEMFITFIKSAFARAL